MMKRMRFNWHAFRGLWLLVLLCLPGCTTLTKETRYIDTSCVSGLQIIHYSKDDTDDTKNQVRADNRVLHSLCPALK